MYLFPSESAQCLGPDVLQRLRNVDGKKHCDRRYKDHKIYSLLFLFIVY